MVYQINTGDDPDGWFDVTAAKYSNYDTPNKRILYTAAPSTAQAVEAALRKAADRLETESLNGSIPLYRTAAQIVRSLIPTEAAQVEARQEPEGCEWKPYGNEDMPGTYEGACGIVWSFTEGSIAENECRFCPRCGGQIVEADSGEVKP